MPYFLLYFMIHLQITFHILKRKNMNFKLVFVINKFLARCLLSVLEIKKTED